MGEDTDIVVDEVGYKVQAEVEDMVGHIQEADDHILEEAAVGDIHQLLVALLGLSETFVELVVVASGQISHPAYPSQLYAGSVHSSKIISFAFSS